MCCNSAAIARLIQTAGKLVTVRHSPRRPLLSRSLQLGGRRVISGPAAQYVDDRYRCTDVPESSLGRTVVIQLQRASYQLLLGTLIGLWIGIAQATQRLTNGVERCGQRRGRGHSAHVSCRCSPRLFFQALLLQSRVNLNGVDVFGEQSPRCQKLLDKYHCLCIHSSSVIVHMRTNARPL